MVRAYVFLLFFVPFTLLHSLVALIGTLFDVSGNFAHRCARSWSRGGLLAAGVRVKVEGAETIPEGPVIFMGNHQSNFDILSLTVGIPRRFSWLAKEELFRIPLFGGAMSRAGYIPLDRGDGRKALRSIEKAAMTIRGGISVVVFPEGTRSLDGKLLPFKKGAFLLASRAGVPVVPFTISGSGRVNPPKRLFLRRGNITLRFHEAVDVAVTPREELQRLVRQEIEKGLQETV